jgi:CRP/FNR family transcriptional regulator, cyclic AMP receptor protein
MGATMSKSVIQISALRKLEKLEWLPAGSLDHLALNMKEERLSKGQSIYRPGQPAKYLYYVLEGTIGIAALGSDDRFVRLMLSTTGQFFGIDAIIRKWRRLSMATALQDSRVGRIDSRVFVTKICGVPWEPFSGLIETLLGPDRKVCLQRAMFLVENLPDRLALVLWQYGGGSHGNGLMRRAQGVLPAALTHDELAAIVGASRPRVSLALKRLERRGFFVRTGKQIQIQEERLRAYLEDRYGFVFWSKDNGKVPGS